MRRGGRPCRIVRRSCTLFGFSSFLPLRVVLPLVPVTGMPMSDEVLSFCRSLCKDTGRDVAWLDEIFTSLQASGFPSQHLAEFVDSSPSDDVRDDVLPTDAEQRAFL